MSFQNPLELKGIKMKWLVIIKDFQNTEVNVCHTHAEMLKVVEIHQGKSIDVFEGIGIRRIHTPKGGD